MAFGIFTQNNFQAFLDSSQKAEVVLASGYVDFSGATVYDRFGDTSTISDVNCGYAFVPITLTKHAIGMTMIGSNNNFNDLAGGVYLIGGTTRGTVPQVVDGVPWATSGGNWSENSTSITIRNLMIPCGIDGVQTAQNISGRAYVLLVGTLPANYTKVSHGLRLYNAAGGITFDSALMPTNARHIVNAPASPMSSYNSINPLIYGGLPAGVKMVANAPIGQARSTGGTVRYINMGMQFSSNGVYYGLRPIGLPWSTAWQSSYGLFNNGARLTRIFYASDYF